MKFLLDQDVYSATAHFLMSLGHDVVLAAQLGLSQAEDIQLLKIAREQDRIFVTRDRDFGNLVFVKASGSGVIYLRMLPSNQDIVHHELQKVIKQFAEEELSKAFVVVDAKGHRIRRVPVGSHGAG
jgi:predicted nuclease of predicted toxin-antitoxin system